MTCNQSTPVRNALGRSAIAAFDGELILLPETEFSV